jgi:hypothetical protein
MLSTGPPESWFSQQLGNRLRPQAAEPSQRAQIPFSATTKDRSRQGIEVVHPQFDPTAA